MLMQLGTVTFEVWPFNTDSYSRDTGYDFVRKDVIGRRRPSEGVGEADELLEISGRLFPEKLGGLEELETLHKMRKSGSAQILVRGDGLNMGWFTIDRVKEQSDHIGRQGVGKRIDFNISLTASDAPTPAAYLSTLLRIFR